MAWQTPVQRHLQHSSNKRGGINSFTWILWQMLLSLQNGTYRDDIGKWLRHNALCTRIAGCQTLGRHLHLSESYSAHVFQPPKVHVYPVLIGRHTYTHQTAATIIPLIGIRHPFLDCCKDVFRNYARRALTRLERAAWHRRPANVKQSKPMSSICVYQYTHITSIYMYIYIYTSIYMHHVCKSRSDNHSKGRELVIHDHIIFLPGGAFCNCFLTGATLRLFLWLVPFGL